MPYKIAIVEDDLDMLELLEMVLKFSGFYVRTFSGFNRAMKSIKEPYDLWLLDVMLKDGSGYDLMTLIKKYNAEKPIIFVSALSSEIDRVKGLELGSDDYITKPFSRKELVLRINNVLRRVKRNGCDEIMAFSDYKLNFEERILYFNDEKVDLTSKEIALLIILVEHAGNIVSREKLLFSVWGIDYFGSGRVLDDTIRRLRKKCENLFIETVYGEGYRLNLI